MLNIAICDDDLKFTGYLEKIITLEADYSSALIDISIFFDGITLCEDIKNGSRYDIVFLDVEMKQVDGISAARSIREIDRTVILVYISGYECYLKELFEVEPYRFLSKPLDTALFSRYFREACEKVKDISAYFQFQYNKEIRKLPIHNIVYFESQNRLITIYSNDSLQQSFYGKLNTIEMELDEGKQRFLRIHQSFLVNYDYVKKINFSRLVLSIGDKERILKISEDRQKEVRSRICKISSGKAVII